MNDTVKKVKQVCKCENCGNEAEMVITCTLQETDTESSKAPSENAPSHDHAKTRTKGTGTCSTCGNEADVWVDL